MRVEIVIANANAAGRNYLTWAPVRTRLRLFDAVKPPERSLDRRLAPGRPRWRRFGQ